MNEAIILSLIILVIGIMSLIVLLKVYKRRLLVNFHQKVQMTIWLGLTFAAFFLVGNFLFARYLMSVDFSTYLQHPEVLAREGLIFFILNAFLLLACRSLIKSLVNFR